ncbi:MAG: hypothetical protein JRC90_09455 [Deltaproteobacteria bacterium]|nr:hypothetical protein [Deltaproteobacteria bacterium]
MKKLLIFCVAVGFVFALGNIAVAEEWNVPGDFATIQDAIDSDDVLDGDTILVDPGNHAGALVTKAVEIKGQGRAVINEGPMLSSYMTGFLFPWSDPGAANGTTISHLSFDEILDLPIYSRFTDDVTVDHCTFTSPMQGITNWNGNGWDISHNVINGLKTMNGGGIGIFVGTRLLSGSTANNNLIAHNTITGRVVVPDYEIAQYIVQPEYPDAGYSVPGITLMSDRRKDPAGVIVGNRILKNKIAISSNNPRNHWPCGIGLSDLGLRNLDVADLLDNKVGFNDVRGMLGIEGTPIALVPDELDESNIISRNLGDDIPNRGHGVNPQVLFVE